MRAPLDPARVSDSLQPIRPPTALAVRGRASLERDDPIAIVHCRGAIDQP